MSITNASQLEGIKKVSEAVALTLKEMRLHAQPGMTTKELDDFGNKVLTGFKARSAPKLTYGFPGFTCISVNHEFCHGIPSKDKVLQEGDLVNIDVSAELNAYWSDNGGSFVLGADIHGHQALVDTSKAILQGVIQKVKGGVPIPRLGDYIHKKAKKQGFKVIMNLAGHGVGASLHEEPTELLNYRDRSNKERLRKNTVIALETFIATRSTRAVTAADGWTLIGNRGGYMAQHEHTVLVTDQAPVVLTEQNNISRF